ncbi:MAG TPA: hypothetical protein VMV38_00905 [Candidatus Paceibacterota bacterium]|nr:hypothetical protein [Candidatus Paceibacterota bacterium]
MSKSMVVTKPEYDFRGNRIINCSAKPVIPQGMILHEHTKGDAFYSWNKEDQKNALWKIGAQDKASSSVSGHAVLKKLGRRSVFNATALDNLLVETDLIPEDEWSGKYIFFPGTIFRSITSHFLFARYLYRAENRRWQSGTKCLSYNWPSNHYMALQLDY